MRDTRNEHRPIRCAVYTRKSTEEGLDQEFNSLDAQREACAAYILSQRHEGWVASPELYDDGGFTGGNMDRPGLKQLMTDVAAGGINVIVVYKVDRLTRSLADFAKIVDVLDAAGASFVSITQSFNTTTSMGRLTLNVLLSFAQFEREVTGERIRDKIAASKKKGIWMGGPVPLGYDVRDRKLVVNEAEAETICHIMQRYLALGSVRALIEELGREDRVTKIQRRASGPHRGGVPFRRGTLFHLLKNRIYLGDIVHKGVAHPGEHPAIVDRDLWDQVQQRLAAQAARRGLGSGADHPSLLIGLVRDGLGRKMSPSHAVKGPKRYRYYVTHAAADGDTPGRRVSAHDLERIVIDGLVAFLADRAAVDAALGDALDAATLQLALLTARATATAIPSVPPDDLVQLLRTYVAAVELRDDRVEIAIRLGALAEQVDRTHFLILPATRVRSGHDVKLVVADTSAPAVNHDPRLIGLVAGAHRIRSQVLERPDQPMAKIAADLGRCRGDLADQMRLSYLAPDIVTAIIDGNQPASLTRKRLAAADLPLDWAQQRQLLGFA